MSSLVAAWRVKGACFWCQASSPDGSAFATAGEDGGVAVYSLHFEALHCTWRDRFAQRSANL